MADEPVYFVVERTPLGERPTIHYDRLQSYLTRPQLKDSVGKPIILKDLKGNVVETNPIIYALRLDRLGPGEWDRNTSLDTLYAKYCELRDSGKLPQSNLADPPRPKGETRIQHGESYVVVNPPWHNQPRAQFLIGGYCGHCKEVVVPGHHKFECPHFHEDFYVNRDEAR